jgi:hypothetical protein
MEGKESLAGKKYLITTEAQPGLLAIGGAKSALLCLTGSADLARCTFASHQSPSIIGRGLVVIIKKYGCWGNNQWPGTVKGAMTLPQNRSTL